MSTHYTKFSGLEIEYTAEGGCTGRSSGPADKCYPAEAPDVEVVSVTVIDPKEVEEQFELTLDKGEVISTKELLTFFTADQIGNIYYAACEAALVI